MTTATRKRKAESGKPAKPPTAAQRKAEQAAEAARQQQRRLVDFRVDWKRLLIYQLLAAEGGVEPEIVLRLLLYFSASPGAWRLSDGSLERSGDLARICRDHDVKMKRSGRDDLDVWSGIVALPNRVDEVAVKWLAMQFWRGVPQRGVPAKDVEAIADFLCIDLQKAWNAPGPARGTRQYAGELTEGLWNIFSREQLAERARLPNVGPIAKSATKAVLVARLLNPKKPLAMPKEVGKAKRPKR
ncbi:MAG TPA: hypothetical protein VM238_17035 [Phycisphaerae bacterium]|nr:hypothetical protein [Phycisphaerae bacterium]